MFLSLRGTTERSEGRDVAIHAAKDVEKVGECKTWQAVGKSSFVIDYVNQDGDNHDENLSSKYTKEDAWSLSCRFDRLTTMSATGTRSLPRRFTSLRSRLRLGPFAK